MKRGVRRKVWRQNTGDTCAAPTRTFAEIELATVPVTILQPNELRVVGGYQVQWVYSGDAETACVRDDSAQPTPDCAFTASFQGP